MRFRVVVLLAAVVTLGAWCAPLPAAGSVDETTQMPGFPVELSSSTFLDIPWNLGGAVLADLDGDGLMELIFSYQSNVPPEAESGTVAVWRSDGTLLPGFPATTVGGAFFAPSVGDLDGDGTLEIVQVTIDESHMARLYAFDHGAQVVAGFPVVTGPSSLADGATLSDMDGDGALEIVTVTDTAVHVFEADGTEWGSAWPAPLGSSAVGTAAVGDVDRDGELEIFVTERHLMHLLDTDGTELDGWPRELAGATFAALSTAALADLDGDGTLEIVVPAWMGDILGGNATSELWVFHHDGSQLAGWPKQEEIVLTECPPVVTDLEGDGELEILIAAALPVQHGETTWENHSAVWAWTASGTIKEGFPWVSEEPTWEVDMLTVADVNGDGEMEVFANAGATDPVSSSGWIHGVDAHGATLAGFPLRPVGGTWLNGAVIGDADGDGDAELAVVSMTDLPPFATRLNLFDLGGSTRTTRRDWPTFHRSNCRGGLYDTASPVVSTGGSEPGSHRFKLE